MALILNSKLMFFSQMFGAPNETVSKAQALIKAGFVFDTELYSVSGTFKGQTYQVKLTQGTTSLLKSSWSDPVVQQNKQLIANWITDLAALHLTPVQPLDSIDLSALQTPVQSFAVTLKGYTPESKLHLIKTVLKLSGLSLKEAKDFVEHSPFNASLVTTFETLTEAADAKDKLKAAGGLEVTVVPSSSPAATKPAPAPKVVNTVIDLKDAVALGQKVHGTSAGSVYYCIAFSEHVKIAARLNKGGAISIRTEWTGNPKDELQKLADAGVQMKQGYGSIHFDSAGVPIERTVGAFLVGVGINWKAAVMNGAELVVG